MASFIIDSTGVFDLSDFFPALGQGVTRIDTTNTEMRYSVNGRTVIVTGTDLLDPLGTLGAITLLDTDGTTVLARFTDLDSGGQSLLFSDFEDLWLNGPGTSVDIVSFLLAGDDSITGGEGENELTAGFGNDTIQGGDEFDVLTYNSSSRTTGIQVVFTSETGGTVSSGGETDSFSEVEALYGTQHGDSFLGTVGSQRFRGFGGNDTFDGGAGNDEVDYRNDAPLDGNGVVVDLSAVGPDGYVTVSGPNGDTDKLRNIEFVRGTRNDDRLTGNALDNRLRGDTGHDTLQGGAGNDRLDGGDGNDSLEGGEGHDVLIGGNGSDTLIGGNGENTLVGGAGGDLFDGRDPDDPANPDDEQFDIVVFKDEGGSQGVNIDLEAGEGTDTYGDSDTFIDIERVIGSQHADRIAGSSRKDEFAGLRGNDTLDGGDGARDELLYHLDADAGGLSGVMVNLATGTATDGFGDTDQISNFEIVRGSMFADAIIGDANQNWLRGLAGNDILDGGGGSDFADYSRDRNGGGGAVSVNLAAGTATDGYGGNDTLINIENVVGTRFNDVILGDAEANILLGDSGDDVLSGGTGDDRLEGGAGSDALDGGAGNDILIGGIGGGLGEDFFQGSIGNDTIHGGDVGQDDDPNLNWNALSYRNAGIAGVTVAFGATSRAGTVTKAGGAGTDTFFSIDAVQGTDGVDSFIGGAGAGNQRFMGFGGNDTFDGSLGLNEVDYKPEARATGATAGVVVDLAAGTALDVTGGTDTLIDIERVRGTENSDRIAGNALDNRLRGDTGHDTLAGGAGNDQIEGGAGTDTAVFAGKWSDYAVTKNASGEIVVVDSVAGRDGQDSIWDVEFFSFANGTFSVTDLPKAETVTTSYTLPADVQNVTATGSANVKLTGNALNNAMTGNKGKNVINGAGGNDVLKGGFGNDKLTGGAGRDVFAFDTKLNKKKNLDQITDFKRKADDLWLDNAIFTKLGKKGSEDNPKKIKKAFFTIGAQAKDKNDFIVYDKSAGILYYDKDGSGAAKAIAFAKVKKGIALKADDFFVI